MTLPTLERRHAHQNHPRANHVDISEAHIEDSPEAVAAALLEAFVQLGAPPPAAWVAHRWRYADSAPALAYECVWENALRLGLCGDWLNGGKVEGAWLRGRALGLRVAASLNQN